MAQDRVHRRGELQRVFRFAPVVVAQLQELDRDVAEGPERFGMRLRLHRSYESLQVPSDRADQFSSTPHRQGPTAESRQRLGLTAQAAGQPRRRDAGQLPLWIAGTCTWGKFDEIYDDCMPENLITDNCIPENIWNPKAIEK